MYADLVLRLRIGFPGDALDFGAGCDETGEGSVVQPVADQPLDVGTRCRDRCPEGGGVVGAITMTA